MNIEKNYKKSDPRLHANLLSKVFFCWIVPIFSYGRRNDLTPQDLPDVFPRDASESLGDQLESNWRKEVTRASKCRTKPSFQRAIIATFGWSFSQLGIVTFLLLVVIKPSQIISLGLLIGHFAPNASSSPSDAYCYATIVVVATILDSSIFCHTLYQARQLGMRLRIAASSLIYRKMIRLSCASANEASGGLVINLLSNDVARFELVLNFLHYVWVTPIQILVIAYFMWCKMGLTSLIGLLAIILQTIPIQVYIGKLVHALRKKLTEKIDRRVLLINEIINGIRVVKMYTWEPFFEKLSYLARRSEIDVLVVVNHLKGAASASFFYINRTSLFITILVYALQDVPLSADKIFMLFQFYSTMQHTKAIALLQGVHSYAETTVSVNRIRRFLLTDEVPPKNNSLNENNSGTISVSLRTVDASWTEDPPLDVLSGIDFDIPSTSIFAITGSVGAGKSSLFKLILGELQPRNGKVSVCGSLSYSSQDPWLFAASVKDNILFGESYDKVKYNRVIQACCLAEDLKQLSHGDSTIVGDKGSSLSGGQCARVNLARAVYRDADIYLLDDPFSALDARVNKLLFEDCIGGYLKDKTRVIVTYQVQFLEKADSIIYLDKGKVVFRGDFKSFQRFSNDVEATLKRDSLEKSSVDEETVINDADASDDIIFQSEENEESSAAEELLAKGKMKKTVYWKYFKACGSYTLLLSTLVCFVLAQVLISGSDYWLAYWTEKKETMNYVTDLQNKNYSHTKRSWDENDSTVIPSTVGFSKNYGLHLYGILIFGTIIMSTTRNILLFKICSNSSFNIHNRMITNVLKAPMSFFDKNPSGRILNRFSKDLGSADEVLAQSMIECLQRCFLVAGILVQILIINLWMVFPMSVMLFLQLKMKNVYLATAQKVKRLEGNAKSPLLSLANSSLSGLLTIRSCRAEKIVCKQFDNQQDNHTPSYSLVISTLTSFGYWVDLISICFVSIVTYSFIVFDKEDTSDEKVGLAITQILGICDTLQYGMKLAGEVVSNMISVERLFQFTKLEQEGPVENEPGNEPPNDWPSKGDIVFDHLYLRYADDVEPTLKNLNLKVRSGTKVGVVGRTGAGKSSLISALFHLAKVEGKLRVDNVDVTKISLRALRGSISVIPQEPFLFSISLRDNLDPLRKTDDATIWAALQEVNLKTIFASLDQFVNQKNLSTGERQLLCLARAILKRSKVLVLDEATANIDPDTDALIQKVIRRNFKDRTVLTIAHRLNTIMDSDKVLVMDQGEAIEFDHPHVLLQKSDTYFAKMLSQLDSETCKHLKSIAYKAYRTLEMVKRKN
ncbi:multidrug resistance-associated protein 4-like [Copidosoma floridanum]|uniref:multidrug resistance-associated protein 4-like n=1 Tax=Copidosoma floridanum TaxID=29053 RepID=UPI000C6F5893|nr:multidrug resistance-associated protein 4-like [Copidosoma floridanum]